MIKIEISDELRNSYRAEDGLNIVFAWCIENFGMPASYGLKRWNTDTYNGFLFLNEEDAVWFALKWM